MSRKGENIYKRKDGRWEGRYRKQDGQGKACYGYIYGKTYREAKELLAQAKAGAGAKPPRIPLHEAGNDICFAQVANEWWECTKPSFRESTQVKYQNMLGRNILPALGGFKIGEIGRKEVNKFAYELLNSGGKNGSGLSTKTVSDNLSLLRSILKFACENDMSVKYTACTLPVEQHPKPLRVLRPEEQDKLCKYLTEHISLSNLGILLSLFTGLRVGELCALKWGDISWGEGILYVRQTMQRLRAPGTGAAKTKVLISVPKSKDSVRSIPLLPELFRQLAAMHQPPDTFFLTGSPTDFVEPRTMQNRFKAVLKACGICDANFHALRHTFATRCVEAGVDAKSLSEILGHAGVKITLNRYVHPTMEQKKGSMDKLGRSLGIEKLLTVR